MIPHALLNEDATLEPYEGVNGHGEAVYGAPQSVRARFDAKRRLVRKEGGQEVVSSATVLLRPTVSCPVKSRITREGRAYEALEVLSVSELNRVHHLEVLVS